jgi:putative transposase
MSSDSTVVRLRQPDEVDDPLTTILRDGARRMLAQAIEAEADAFVAAMQEAKLPDGRQRVVRHGHGPERAIQTGIGPVAVRRAVPPAVGETHWWSLRGHGRGLKLLLAEGCG